MRSPGPKSAVLGPKKSFLYPSDEFGEPHCVISRLTEEEYWLLFLFSSMKCYFGVRYAAGYKTFLPYSCSFAYFKDIMIHLLVGNEANHFGDSSVDSSVLEIWIADLQGILGDA